MLSLLVICMATVFICYKLLSLALQLIVRMGAWLALRRSKGTDAPDVAAASWTPKIISRQKKEASAKY